LFYEADFSCFGPFSICFGQFRRFSEAIFPFFAFFPTSTPVFPSNESRGRTIAHRQQELKPRNWPPQLAVFIFVYLGVKALVSFGLMVFEYSQDMLMTLAGPTSSTHHSSARGGGLDTLFPSFFPLFWVAK
jgi:hypothetical protein